MQLSSRDGILCDQCGASHRKDFTYYSFDYRLISVIDGRKPSLRDIIQDKIIFSLDICEQCYDKIKKLVIKNYNSIMTNNVKNRGKNNQLICEISGNKITGLNIDYYYCTIVKVEVMMTGQPNICSNCQTPTYQDDKVCAKCEGTAFVRLANTKSTDRILEINMCEESFRDMVNKAEQIRKLATEWSTES